MSHVGINADELTGFPIELCVLRLAISRAESCRSMLDGIGYVGRCRVRSDSVSNRGHGMPKDMGCRQRRLALSPDPTP